MCLGITGVVTGINDDGGVPMAILDPVLANTALANTALANTALASTVLASTGHGEPVTACLLTCPDAQVGDTVLAHSGYVLRILDHREVTS